MPTTPKQIEAKIKKANALYKRSTPAQRRVLIAKDGLKQIKAKNMVACSGLWTSVNNGGEDELAPLQPILHAPTTDCRCCGVGAIFLGYVRLNNNARVDNGWYYEDIREITGWPSDNLRFIELAFEQGHGRYSAHSRKDRKAVAFGNSYKEHHDRLVAILKNIVKNNGTFKP